MSQKMDRLDGMTGKTSYSRWSRKPDISTASINQSLNASLQLNCTLADSLLPCNVSVSLLGGGGSQGSSQNKTPNQSPSRHAAGKLTPSHSFSRATAGTFNSSKKLSKSYGNLTNLSMNAGKTPNRTPSRGPDRFIPDRSTLNLDLSHYLLTNENNVEGDGDKQADVQDNEKGAVGGQTRKALTDALLGDMSSYRIINCRQQQPNDSRSTVSDTLTKAGSKTVRRHIPSQPERILDAPDVINDYYLQLIDWGSNGLLAVALSREVYIWDSRNGDISNLMSVCDDDYIASLSWIPGGNHLAIGTGNHALYIYDVIKGKKLRTLTGHPSRISCLSWNEYILSAGCRSGDILHHDVRAQESLAGSSKVHSHEVCGLKWSPTGQYLASGGNDNQIVICSASCKSENNPTPVYTFDQHQAAVKAIGWCPWKPNVLATGGGTADRCIKIWNINTGENTFSVDTKTQVCSLLWSLNHQELISGHGYPSNPLTIWKYPGLTKIQDLAGHTSRILGMGMSPDGQTVVSLGSDETLRFWDCFQVDKSKSKKQDLGGGKENLLTKLTIR